MFPIVSGVAQNQASGPSTPVASFATVPAPIGPTPLVVDFADTSSNSPTSWAWTVNVLTGGSYSYTNGTNANQQNPQITFVNGGGPPDEWHVVLAATNAAGTGTSNPTTITSLP